MATITIDGYEYDFEAMANMMDDEIREELHAQGIDEEQEFADAYLKAHEERFGETFQM